MTGTKYKFIIPAILVMAGILVSCTNDLDSIQKIEDDPNAADEVIDKLNLVYSDSAIVQVKIFSNHAETFHKPKDRTEMSQGLIVDFFDKKGKISSRLTAIYGEINHKSGQVYVRDSVRLINYERDQVLETEDLYWNQRDSSIYTKKNVVIRSRDSKIKAMGRGLSTTQKFELYTIDEPTGEFEI